ncbi:MAG TPA: nucleotidyltransferase [Gemmatimonadaceae bacterium]|nr:nucleotidyltransferase [Gemmatimonadaceae bacterium]
MAYQSTFDHPGRDTNAFYRRTLHVLSDARVPFLVGGSHAVLNYTGIIRETKDFDLFVRKGDLDAALEALRQAGYHTEVTFPHWLAKAKHGDDVVDLVFSSGNGVCVVDDDWFQFAMEADVLGMPVKIAPVEELLWQKAFVMERERYDGADVAHILRTCAETLDWERVMRRFEPHWQLLLSYLILFSFIYPSERQRIPERIMSALIARLQQDLANPPSEDRVCQGTLTSRSQYLLDIGRYGYEDARLVPRGNMTAEDAVYWTWAIENIH